MRYAAGTLTVSDTRDIPVLLHIRNAKFISHDQLWKLMHLQNYEHSRASFNWRMRRLIKANYVSICDSTFGRGMVVYQISRNGLCQLENAGQFAVVLNSRTQHLPHPSQAYHALELISIRIALANALLLAGWRSDIETASANTVAQNGITKDYDALVDVWNGSQLARFGLEYERTLKSAKRYKEIRLALERDRGTTCVLYLTSGFDVAWHLAHELSGVSKRLAFATAPTFRQRLLMTEVITDPQQQPTPFMTLLHGVF